MASVLTKTLAAGGSVAIISTYSTSITYLITHRYKRISDLLTKEGFKLLEKTPNVNGDWNSKWNSFKSKYNTNSVDKKKWGLDNLQSNGEAPSEFQDKCISLSKETITLISDPLYSAVKEFCAIKVK